MGIRLIRISKSYNSRRILDSVSLSVEGGLMLLIGPNGSGKTTLMRIIAGVLPPDKGEVEVSGMGALYVPEKHARDSWWTPLRFCRILGDCDEKALEEHAYVLGLENMLSKPFRRLSMGEARKLFIAVLLASAGEKDTILIDEPFANVDAGSRDKLWKLIESVHRERPGRTTVISTHILARGMLGAAESLAALHEGSLHIVSAERAVRDLGGRKVLVGPGICGRKGRAGEKVFSLGPECYAVAEPVDKGLDGQASMIIMEPLLHTGVLYAYVVSMGDRC